MELNLDTPGHYSIKLEEVAKDKSFSSVVRLLATDLLKVGYINIGEFIKSMTDNELETLLSGMESDNHKQYEEMLLMGEMLAVGEGCDPSQNDEDFAKRAEQLSMLLAIESLARKGFVKAYHENFSFHDDCGDKIIVEKLDE
jgi:hypothetical protein